MGKIISLPTKKHQWEIKFKTPVRHKTAGILPFKLMLGPQVSKAWVEARTLQQARHIVSQHIPVSEWVD